MPCIDYNNYRLRLFPDTRGVRVRAIGIGSDPGARQCAKETVRFAFAFLLENKAGRTKIPLTMK